MRKNLLLTPLVAVLAGGLLQAQDLTTAVMAGRVTGQDGQPLAGVRLQLQSPSMLLVRQVTTDANGQFRVALLPNGLYTVTYSLSGYITRKLTLTLVAGQVANASTRLTPVSVQAETVEISASSTTVAQIDKTDTIVQTSYSADFLEMLSGRSISNLGRLAPGINTTNPVSESSTRVHIRGGTGASTRVMVNGATIDNMVSNETMTTLLPIGDLIESLAIIQSPLNSRYGNSDGGLVSAVTARGTNTFSGTVRWNISRSPGWSAVDQAPGYPYRDPNSRDAPTTNAGNENYSKNMEFSLTGPIWKDHITFSYGTRLTPTTYGINGLPWSSYLGSITEPQPWDRMGTYYLDSTGDVIRKAELYDAGEYNAVRTNIVQQTFNQFSVYWQVLPEHQVEWGYTQFDVLRDNVGRQSLAEIGPWDTNDLNQRSWNLAYRGIIGSSGVLEARYSRGYFWWGYGVRGGDTPPPIRTYTIGSYRPIDGNFGNGDNSNYWASGYLGAQLSTGNMASWDLTGNGAMPPTANTGLATVLANGLTGSPPGDGGTTDDLVVNYQHMLNTNMGSHLFDVGLQANMSGWKKRASTNVRNFNAVGHISRNLTAADIYNPSGVAGRPATYYQDKYIVFNVPEAKFSHIDPWGVNHYGIVDKYIINRETGMFEIPFNSVSSYGFPGDNTFAGPGVPLPYFYYRYGEGDGTLEANNFSYYINDIWSINNHHSIMAGLRLDAFSAANSLRDLSSYIMPTFRFEYKWDLYGDQSRLFNVSWGQFHTFQGMGPFGIMTPTDGNKRVVKFWDKGSATPYLVSKAELMDESNYGYDILEAESGTTYTIDPDWRSTVSTEMAVGMTRNLGIGGFYKLSFIYRTWANDWNYYPGGYVIDATGTKTFERILRNATGYERTYKGVELTWEIPLHKRLSFLGSYTYNRFVHNTPDSVDLPAYWQIEGNNPVDWGAYRDEVMGGREVWAPLGPRQPEHYLKAFLLFDISSGRAKSSIALDWQYTSSSFQNLGYTYGIGEPYQLYPELITGPGAIAVPGTTGRAGMTNAAATYPVMGLSHGDSWSLAARYLLTVPIHRKLAWMMTIHIDNPFNHRYPSSGWFSATGDSNFVIYSDNVDRWGTASGLDQSNGGHWRATGDFNGLYRSRQGGRAFSFNTGIKF